MVGMEESDVFRIKDDDDDEWNKQYFFTNPEQSDFYLTTGFH